MSESPNKVFLLPGEYMVSKQPHIISTLLGSCVSVCLYHPQHHFGGMNHYMLAHGAAGERGGKYGDYAINVLLQFMEQACGGLGGVEAMIMGGASVVGAIGSGDQIGIRNVALAREMLARHNIRVVKEQVGGSVGLKLHYQNWDNHIIIEPMSPMAMSGSMLVRAEGPAHPAHPAPAHPAHPAAAHPAPAHPAAGTAQPQHRSAPA